MPSFGRNAIGGEPQKISDFAEKMIFSALKALILSATLCLGEKDRLSLEEGILGDHVAPEVKAGNFGGGEGGLGDGHRWIIPYFKRRHSNMEVKYEFPR